MHHQLSLEIPERIEEVFRSIKTGEYNTAFAEEVEVSVPSISRFFAALIDQGNDIRSVRNQQGWRDVFRSQTDTRGTTLPKGETNREHN